MSPVCPAEKSVHGDGATADGSQASDDDASVDGTSSHAESSPDDSDTGAPSHADSEERGAAPSSVKRAAVAMAVGVGSFSDPEDLQGLSHYLEHMLFMGSEDFPGENEYDDYLTRRAGSSNAYTDAEYTNYHFDVEPGALRGALERFSAFFKCPLCLESALEREVCCNCTASPVNLPVQSYMCQCCV